MFFISKAGAWFRKHERVTMPAALFFGFIVDSLTLQRIDLLFENLVLFSYLCVAGLGVAFLNLYDGGPLKRVFFARFAPWVRLLTQFAFGGLFSGYAVFYLRSAAFPDSWFFVGLLFFILVGNEVFRKTAARVTFQMSIFFVALFSFSIFYLPIVFKEIGTHLFLAGGAASVLFIALFSYTLSRFVPERIGRSKRALFWSIGGIYLFLNVLYFTNSIPPIPLALKEIGVYHSISRTAEGSYTLLKEEEEWYAFFAREREVHKIAGEPIYVWSAVFAPAGLRTPIFHRWYHFDRVRDVWVRVDTFSFPITGGRDGGYRGFSRKTGTIPGHWRVDVVTERGALLGRVSFSVVEVDTVPALFEVTR